MREVVLNVAAAYGATAKFTYDAQLPGDREPPRADRQGDRDRARRRRRGAASTPNAPPVMGGEDFSYMLEARPGAFIFIGNGDTRRPAPPGLRFQRRGDRLRLVLLGAAGGDG